MKIQTILALSFGAVPILVILLSNLFQGAGRRQARRILAAGAAGLQAINAAVSLWLLLNSGESSFAFSLNDILTAAEDATRESFALTPFGLVILFCAGIVCLCSVLIASRTVRQKTNSYTNLLMILMLSMTGLVTATDLFTLYAFMEVTGVASFILIAMFREDASLEGAFKYLVMSSVAGVLIVSGLALLFMQAGSLRFADIRVGDLLYASHSKRTLLFASAALMLSGFCIKAGAAPFHSWLPDAHQSADTAVSVLLSGIVIKAAGVYGLMTIARLFAKMEAVGLSLRIIGLLSVVAGALLALRQSHFKRVAAYSSVSQMGYLLLGIGSGSALGYVGAAAHVFSHAMFKSTLFANAAALHEQAGTLELGEMGGLQKKMPVTGVTSVIAFFSTAGIPPFAGFWSKLLILLALWLAGEKAFACAGLGASLLTGAYFLRLQRKAFFGKLPERFENIKEIDGGVRAAEILLTVFTVAGGLLFPLLLQYLAGLGLI